MRIEIPLDRINNLDSLVELEVLCPIDIKRTIAFMNNFESHIDYNLFDLDLAKKDLSEARKDLDLIISTLIQLFHKRDILKTSEDKMRFDKLSENLEILIKNLNKYESRLLDFEGPKKRSLIGYAHLTNYSRQLQTIKDLLIESLIASTKEYYKFEEINEIKREPRTFLYILYSTLETVFNFMSAGEAGDTTNIFRKGSLNLPMSWQGSMSENGQKLIRDDFKNEISRKVKSLKDEDIEQYLTSIDNLDNSYNGGEYEDTQ